MRYKGIVFDLDGTLVNSLEDLTDACNDVMDSYRLPQKTYEEGRRLIGRGLRNLIKGALPKAMAEDVLVLDEAERRIKTAYAKRYTNKTRPYPGIVSLLETLKAKGISFGVCTNKPDDAAKMVVAALFNAGDFVDIRGQRNDKPRKPDPAQTLEVAAKMGVRPEECLYVGDSSIDYETGKNAGMQPVLCLWGFGDKKQLLAYDDAACIQEAGELTALIEQ